MAEELPTMETMSSPVLGRNSALEAMLDEKPVWRVKTPAGDEAWLVIGYPEIRELLLDRRLGRTHSDPDNAAQYVRAPIFHWIRSFAGKGDDYEAHARFRLLLAPYFTNRRMKGFRERVRSIVNSTLDGVLASGPPVDLLVAFGYPVAAQVTYELLGVPESEWETVTGLVYGMSDLDDQHGATANAQRLLGYLEDLAARKRVSPDGDVLSGMCAAGVSDAEAAMMMGVLLFAGNSVGPHIGNGMVRLLADAELRQRVLDSPDVLPNAIEELLRTANFGGSVQPHYALEDIEIGDVTMRRGELVMLDFGLANFDRRAFDDPARVDFDRAPNPHITFARGAWHCIGAPLARMELQEAFSALLTQLPNLRLTVSVQELNNANSNRLSSSLAAVPVTW